MLTGNIFARYANSLYFGPFLNNIWSVKSKPSSGAAYRPREAGVGKGQQDQGCTCRITSCTQNTLPVLLSNYMVLVMRTHLCSSWSEVCSSTTAIQDPFYYRQTFCWFEDRIWKRYRELRAEPAEYRRPLFPKRWTHWTHSEKKRNCQLSLGDVGLPEVFWRSERMNVGPLQKPFLSVLLFSLPPSSFSRLPLSVHTWRIKGDWCIIASRKRRDKGPPALVRAILKLYSKE